MKKKQSFQRGTEVGESSIEAISWKKVGEEIRAKIEKDTKNLNVGMP